MRGREITDDAVETDIELEKKNERKDVECKERNGKMGESRVVIILISFFPSAPSFSGQGRDGFAGAAGGLAADRAQDPTKQLRAEVNI